MNDQTREQPPTEQNLGQGASNTDSIPDLEADGPKTVRSLRDNVERKPERVPTIRLMKRAAARAWSAPVPVWTLLAVFAFAVALGLTAGFVAGQAHSPPNDPFDHYCGYNAATMTPAAVARRNVVWRTWNGDNSVDPESPEAQLADTLAAILHPQAPDSLRGLSALFLSMNKGEGYADDGEREALYKIISGSNPVFRVLALRQIVQADAKADELLRQVLCDGARVSAFINGEKVPLETLPDGTAP